MTELTVEELIGIVSQDDSIIPTLAEDKTNAREFIREFKAKDGTTLVPNYLLYYTYVKLWKPQGVKLSKIGFLRKMSVVFKTKRSDTTRYYLLTGEEFNLSEESLNDAKRFDKRYRNKIAKESKQKKQRKVSRIKEEIQLKNETGLH